MTSILLNVVPRPAQDKEVAARLDEWFVSESLAASEVLDGAAVMAGDFRIDLNGHLRFAVFAGAGTGARRIGRIVQRLCEIETCGCMPVAYPQSFRCPNLLTST